MSRKKKWAIQESLALFAELPSGAASDVISDLDEGELIERPYWITNVEDVVEEYNGIYEKRLKIVSHVRKTMSRRR